MIKSIHAAMAKKREDLEKGEQGFTLIELLVVILIIGILAAIAIPVFLGQQDQAKDAAAKSDLGNAKIAMISYATANDGVYATTAAELKNYGYTSSTTAVMTIQNAATPGAFCLSVQSDTLKATFGVDDSSKIDEGTCVSGAFVPKP